MEDVLRLFGGHEFEVNIPQLEACDENGSENLLWCGVLYLTIDKDLVMFLNFRIQGWFQMGICVTKCHHYSSRPHISAEEFGKFTPHPNTFIYYRDSQILSFPQKKIDTQQQISLPTHFNQ